MKVRWLAGLIAAVFAVAPGVHAACRIRTGTFPLEPNPTRALVKAEVNGQPVVFMVDTGAWISSMPYPDAKRLKVAFISSGDMTSEGIGGGVATGEVRFNLKLGNTYLPNEAMAVLGMGSLDNGAVGLIGMDLLGQHDIELDLPDNAIRMVQAEQCAVPGMVYWNKPYSQTALEADNSATPQILLNVKLNGHSIPALLDSGTPQSVVTEDAARAAGVALEKAQIAEKIGGIGQGRVASRVAHFDTFTIGDETIKNTELVVSAMWKYNKLSETGTRLGSEFHALEQPRMLLGADFLRAHRVLIARSQGLILFSYMGGPVFDISRQAVAKPQQSASTPAPKTTQ